VIWFGLILDCKNLRAEQRGGRREKAKRISTTDQTDLTDGILFIGRSGKLDAKARETQSRSAVEPRPKEFYGRKPRRSVFPGRGKGFTTDFTDGTDRIQPEV
jgi:hypothetical protein